MTSRRDLLLALFFLSSSLAYQPVLAREDRWDDDDDDDDRWGDDDDDDDDDRWDDDNDDDDDDRWDDDDDDDDDDDRRRRNRPSRRRDRDD